MPELPEVENTVLSLRKKIKDKKVKEVIIRERVLREKITDELLEIKNKKIKNIHRRAKYIVINFLDFNKTLLVHLGMSGSFTYQKKENETKKHSHIDIILENSDILRFNDPRKFGFIQLTKNYNNNKYIKNLGVEPLTKKFNSEYLYNSLSNKKKTIKQSLMDSSIVVGIGNIYASEILFLSKILPMRSSNKIEKTEIDSIVLNTKNILLTAINNGGTTLKDFHYDENKKGNNQKFLNVYQQKKCCICGNKIKEINISGRNTFFCSKCQK
tara:strand:- start:9480 stop:10289 length:810 start_codon:yes stop_codon:yes gene_type:complete